MSYLVFHHGTFWFQIRVPKTLVPRYGGLIRQSVELHRILNHYWRLILSHYDKFMILIVFEFSLKMGHVIDAKSWKSGSDLNAN